MMKKLESVITVHTEKLQTLSSILQHRNWRRSNSKTPWQRNKTPVEIQLTSLQRY